MHQFKNIIENKDLLRTISKSKSKYRNVILKKADRHLVEAICECVYNLLLGNIKISDKDKEKLVRYKKALRKLVEKSNLKKKKKILIQNGGFLEYLIPAVITGISSIISSVISNKEE